MKLSLNRKYKMNNLKWALFGIITCLLLLVSCNDKDGFVTGPPEDTSFNSAYEDSILCIPEYRKGILIGSINGTGFRNLCDSLYARDPLWSPNKRKILFAGSRFNDNWCMYQIDVKDYLVKRIAVQDTQIRYAAYSPDMKYIAYSDIDGNSCKIKLYDIKTEFVRDITGSFNNGYRFSWSPNSKDILFMNGRVTNIENPGRTELFYFKGYILSLSWSPDGTKIAFCGSSYDNTSSGLYIYDLAAGVTKLLYPFIMYTTSWSRDSKQILFDQSGSVSKNYLCKINIDSTNYVQVTDGTEDIWKPCWYK
jgi:TolB protein